MSKGKVQDGLSSINQVRCGGDKSWVAEKTEKESKASWEVRTLYSAQDSSSEKWSAWLIQIFLWALVILAAFTAFPMMAEGHFTREASMKALAEVTNLIFQKERKLGSHQVEDMHWAQMVSAVFPNSATSSSVENKRDEKSVNVDKEKDLKVLNTSQDTGGIAPENHENKNSSEAAFSALGIAPASMPTISRLPPIEALKEPPQRSNQKMQNRGRERNELKKGAYGAADACGGAKLAMHLC